ncbi:MAG: hypothetical protein AAGL17_15145 [Cyanobacteria bacterium J06576_12]
MTQPLTHLIEQAEALPILDQLTLIAHLAQNLKSISEQTASEATAQNPDTPVSGKTLWQLADDFTTGLSPEAISQLPHDGAAEHDHYIYGTPKNRQ